MATKYLITGGAGNLAVQLTHGLALGAGEIIVLFDLAEQPVSAPADGMQYHAIPCNTQPATFAQ